MGYSHALHDGVIRQASSAAMQTQALQIHRTPGRLRVRSPQLKLDPARGRLAQSCLAQMSGVQSVHLNLLTGSLLIHFDPGGNTSESLLRVALSVSNVQTALPPASSKDGARPVYSRATRKVARVACVYAGEKLVEHLLGVLIAAVL